MQLLADRFAVDDHGAAIDLATGECVSLVVSTAGGPTEQTRWAERCAWFSTVVHPSLAPLLDYGAVGETRRFEAWGAQPPWRGAHAAAAQALSIVDRFLAAHGRAPLSADSQAAGDRAGRPIVVPDAGAGAKLVDATEPLAGDQRELLGVIRQPDRRLAPLAEIFAGPTSGRVVAVAVWAPASDGIGAAVRTLARAARLGGYVPVSASLFAAPLVELLRGRTLVLFAREDADSGWRSVLDASLDASRSHMVLFAGAAAVRRVHTVSLERLTTDALIASVSPPEAARRHMRHVSTAARRSQGLRDRFEQLLFGAAVQGGHVVRYQQIVAGGGDGGRHHKQMRCDAFRRGEESTEGGEPAAPGAQALCPVPLSAGGAAHRSARSASQRVRSAFSHDEYDSTSSSLEARYDMRVAELQAVYASRSVTLNSVGPAASPRAWPAPGELTRLRRQLEGARTLLAGGRYQPGERAARQVMHAFARRGEWSAAAHGALLLATSLAKRGRMESVASTLAAARPWVTQARDLQQLQELSILNARVLTECGRLVDAESLLETVLVSAMSADGSSTVDATLALVRCLYWQGRFSDAWQRLTLVQPEAECAPRAAVQVWVVQSRVSIGRGRIADAVADAARARDAALVLGDAALCGSAFHASSLALLAAGDSAQAEAAAVSALAWARRAHDPLLALCARVLRADILRRRGQCGPAALLVRRMGRVPASALPGTVRARVELLRDVLGAIDATDAAEQRAESTGFAALRLFAPARPPAPSSLAPATDDIIDLLRCCQAADEDNAVLVAVCSRLRARLHAAGVAFFAVDRGELVSVAVDGVRVDIAGARRVLTANQLVLPHGGGERVEAGVPVRYAGQVVGLLVATWTPAAAWHAGDVSLLLSTGAAAAGPALSGLLARRAGERTGRGSELLGVSSAMAEVRAAVEKAAGAPFPVLVEGESGSGKELVAQLLYRLGARRDRPFCTLNCAALPDDLVESELFGHARGAFTGAAGERRGVFEDAHTGTLFLDEIGELSPRAQAKLLRAIQEGEIRRVGENVCRRIDVRLVTATNRDLRAEGAAGRFRLDLLYRLDVIRITVPPLRERRDDIIVLAEHFWRDAASRVGSRATLSAAALGALSRYDWPGNVRELQNVLASLVVRSPRRGVVPTTALPPLFNRPEVADAFTLETARRTFDRAFVRAALVRAGGHRSRAAEELGLSRQGLAKLIERLAIAEEGTHETG